MSTICLKKCELFLQTPIFEAFRAFFRKFQVLFLHIFLFSFRFSNIVLRPRFSFDKRGKRKNRMTLFENSFMRLHSSLNNIDYKEVKLMVIESFVCAVMEKE